MGFTMLDFLKSLVDALIDRSPRELIGACCVATAMAMIAAGIYALLRRKSAENPSVVGVMTLVASVVSMAVTVGYVRHAGSSRPMTGAWDVEPSPSTTTLEGRAPGPAPRPSAVPPPSIGFLMVVTTDRNRDGRLTAEELAQFLGEADKDGDDQVDMFDIDRLLLSRMAQPREVLPPKAPEQTDRDRTDSPAVTPDGL
jgi:hypothetical protein